MSTPKKPSIVPKPKAAPKPKLVKKPIPEPVNAEHLTTDEILPVKPFVAADHPHILAGDPVDHSNEYVQSRSGPDFEDRVIRGNEPKVMTHAPGCVLGEHKGNCLDASQYAAGLHVATQPSLEKPVKHSDRSQASKRRKAIYGTVLLMALALAALYGWHYALTH